MGDPVHVLIQSDPDPSPQDAMDCIRLMAQEVMPALREIGDELGP